ncbi:S-adenosyl-L-methionine-dependent methyltransferase [Biscogniauxia marginata]|nr:S-adenosyl-L-methionine-dependent methyltransferase [Biscogniauxia marginata]
MSPSAAEAIIASLDRINLESLDNDRDARLQVLEAARRMLARIETPFERAWQLSWTNGSVHAVCQVILDLGLWQAWLESGKQEVSLEELLVMCKVPCDMMLLRRLFRLLNAVYIVEETGQDRYRPTPFSLALGKPDSPVTQTIIAGTHHGIDSCRNLPRFLARTSYEEPLDPTDTNYMDLTPERQAMFARCQANTAYQASFIGFMEGLNDYKLDWTEVYDTRELLDGFDVDGSAALFVDVGGAHGLDVTRLLDRYPDLPPGKLILQDTPDVVEMVKVSDKITAMAYDFFTPQPVKGARAYFMHSILHDWDDRDARRILGRVAAAMATGFSKLLLYETFVPSTGATLYHSAVDIALMHLVSASERSEIRWRWLLQSAGFEVVRVWSHPSSLESVIEAELLAE